MKITRVLIPCFSLLLATFTGCMEKPAACPQSAMPSVPPEPLSASYPAQVDAMAYRVILWKNGDWRAPATVEGLYKDLKPDGTAEHEQCRVRIGRKNEGNSINWTIEITPKGDWGVAEVQYPMLFLPALEDDYLVLGKRIGQRIPMSYAMRRGDVLPGWASRSETGGVPDLFNKKCAYWDRYPGELTLQMIAYENDDQGVMIWTPDSEGWVKDFVVAKEDLDETHRGKGYRAYIVHFPENTGQKGTGFKSPYPVVTTAYKGGWYEAALIYKEWARKQWWCAKGKIYDRPNTPSWFKEMQYWSGFAGRPEWARKGIMAAKQILGSRFFGAQYMNWSAYFNAGISSSTFLPAADEKEFQANIDLQKDGIYLAPYLIFSGLVPHDEEVYAVLKESTLRNADGIVPTTYWSTTDSIPENRRKEIPKGAQQLVNNARQYKADLKKAWSGPVDEGLIARLKEFPMPSDLLASQQKLLRENWGRDAGVIDKIKIFFKYELACLGDGKYLEHSVNVTDKMLKDYHAPMAYFDTFPHQALPCYNKTHGHPLGYGRYITQGHRALCKKVLEKNPSAILVCESGSAEYLLDVMHVTYHKGLIGVEYAIPLFSTVYQGFLEYNGWWMWPPYERDEDFTSTLAFSTHLGYMPGSAISGGPLAQLIKLKAAPEDPKIKFTYATIDMRLKYRDYVASGERLRDTVVEGTNPREARWSDKSGKYATKIKIPPVLASRWEKNGEKGKELILVSNDSAEKQTVTVDGHKMELEPYSWQGLEVKGSGERQSTGKAASMIELISSGVELGKKAAEPKAAPKAAEYTFGAVMGIDKIKKVLTVETVDSKGNTAIKKALKFQLAPESKLEGIEQLEKLSVGDIVEVYYKKQTDGQGLAGIVEKLIYKPEGRKPEEG